MKLDDNKENSDILRLKRKVVVAKVYENNIDCRIILKWNAFLDLQFIGEWYRQRPVLHLQI